MKRFIASSALLLSLAFTSTLTPAHATTVLKVDVSQMTAMSEWVVRARITAVENIVKAADGEGPFTDVHLVIDEVYRGPANAAPTKTLVMRLMGGAMDNGLAMKVPGMPRFKVGEEAVLFLEKTAFGFVPCGLEQGVWRVIKGPFGYEVVQQTVLDLNLVTRSADGKLTQDAHHGPHRASKLLGVLAAEIRAATPR